MIDNKGMKVEKGYLYTLEVLIALSILFVTLVYVFKAPAMKSELEISIIKISGYEALEYLDAKGYLREAIASENETGIESQLKGLLVENIHFETEICRSDCNQTNVPKNETVIAMDYYSTGYRNYDNKKLRLWLWKKY